MYESNAQARKAILEILETMDSHTRTRLEPLFTLPADSFDDGSTGNYRLISSIRKIQSYSSDPKGILANKIKDMLAGHTRHDDDQDLWILAFVLQGKFDLVLKKLDELVERMEHVENLAERLDEG